MKYAITLAAMLALVPMAYAADDVAEPPPAPARFQPWQRAWQCNDIRVTETVNQPGIVNYDLGGTIWGGAQFTLDLKRDGLLYFNRRPCLPLR